MSAINTTYDSEGLDAEASRELKTIHQRGFKWLMVLLFTLACLGTVLGVIEVFGTGWIALWAALLLAPLVGLRMIQIYRWATRSHKLRRSLDPGHAYCPRCRSLQTDLEDVVLDDQVTMQRICFGCDHRWAP